MERLADAELVVTKWLRADDGVTAISARIYTELPDKPQFPLVIVKRIGGLPVLRWVDRATMQFEAWGRTKEEARALAAEVQRAMWDAEGRDAEHENGAVVGVREQLGLSWQPDQPTGRARYIFGLEVTIHPKAA